MQAGDHARTLADLETLGRLAPESRNHRTIGLMHFYLGRYAESAAAMSEALRHAPGEHYAALWRYLAQSRLGQAREARAALTDAAKTLPAKWPAAAVEHYLGRASEPAVFAAANDPDPKKRADQLCEANFYVAMARILRNQGAQAVPLLQAAEKDCPRDFAEYSGAVVELKRTKPR
jgi:lipoprotein NlpI